MFAHKKLKNEAIISITGVFSQYEYIPGYFPTNVSECLSEKTNTLSPK